VPASNWPRKAAPNALAITRETLAPLDAKERETLMALLENCADGRPRLPRQARLNAQRNRADQN
jgi:hypothetical protein